MQLLRVSILSDETVSCLVDFRRPNGVDGVDVVKFDIVLNRTNQTVEQLELEATDRIKQLVQEIARTL